MPALLVLAGSFRSLSLFLLAFSPVDRSLRLAQHVPAFGPHQYLAVSHCTHTVYTTTWAHPPALHSWAVDRNASSLSPINSVPITATSSYIAIPAPYTHVYSTGGPAGEVHLLNHPSGAIGSKIQEFLFVPDDQLSNTDKTRTALRFGSHGIEFSLASSLAFVPVLGTNSIEVYTHETPGLLTHLASIPSPRGPSSHDGPRHVKVHPNGSVLYCVTEHSNYVDTYVISPSPPYLTYGSSHSIIPPYLRDAKSSAFRGDTLLVSPSTNALFTTTRGSTTDTRGWLSVFALDEDGFLPHNDTQGVEWYETPTSGGKANAIDVLPKSALVANATDPLFGAHHVDSLFESAQGPFAAELEPGIELSESVWILLTDDDDSVLDNGGGVRVLEWDGWGTGGFKEVATWPDPLSPDQEKEELRDVRGPRMLGGSHAIWL
ncbi:hypothetical protein AX14_001156 [Amanita brunnescens Koide BX004]|nr:hypothetical protein AX14_001156 [Amanita brunnescens Koide BX004]